MDAPDSLVLLLTQIQGSSLFGSDIITHPSQARPMPHATPRIHPHRIRKKLLELLAIYSFRTRRCLPWMGSNRLCVRRPPGDGGSRRRRAGPGLQATVLAKGLQAPATVPAKGGSRGRQPRSPAVAHGPRLSVRLPCVLGVQPTDNNNDGERTSGRAEVRCVAHRAAVQQGVRASGGHRRLPAWFSWRPSNIRWVTGWCPLIKPISAAP